MNEQKAERRKKRKEGNQGREGKREAGRERTLVGTLTLFVLSKLGLKRPQSSKLMRGTLPP